MTNLRGKIRHASRQSDLSRWLHDNHSWFANELKEAGVPNWDKITELLGNAGLTDKNGNPYNKEAVRKGVDRFFRKFPTKLPISSTPPPLSLPNAPPPAVSRETEVQAEIQASPSPQPDFIAISQQIKNKRTIK